MGHKRRRDVSPEASRRAEVYEDLANLDQSIRLKAAHRLLTEIIPGGDADQVHEILRRLIRGLCSGRKAARLGFSVALTEVLITLQKSQESFLHGSVEGISEVLDILINQTQVGGGVESQENRDHQIGRLFGAEAVLKSGILTQSHVSVAVFSNFLDLLFELAKSKSWLREQCVFVLYRLFEDTAGLEDSFAQAAIDRLHSFGLAKTPEGVAIWIIISKNFPDVKLPSEVWRRDDPLCREEKARLALVLKEASSSEIDVATPHIHSTQKGSWSQKLHFAWQAVIIELMSPAIAERLDFREFWDECVEKSLFSKTASNERKYWGFVLMQRALDIANNIDHFTSIFSPNLVHCMTNHLASQERYLFDIAHQTRRVIVDKVRARPGLGVMIIEVFLTNGHINFDKASKTQTIEDILSRVEESSYSPLCEIYKGVILMPGLEDSKSASQARQIASDQLLSAVKSMQRRSEKLNSDEDQKDSANAIKMILSLLAGFAYFDFGMDCEPEITEATRNVFRARLSSCLTYLTANAKDSANFAAHVTGVISKRRNIPDHAKLLLNVESNIQETLDQTVRTIQDFKKKSEKSKSENRSFINCCLLLVSVVFLQVHDGDLDAVGMLEELNNSFPKRNSKDFTKRDDHSSKALIEILLGLAAKPSKLFRRLSQQVFESMAQDVDEDALDSMLTILNAKENSEGQSELFDLNDEQGDLNGAEISGSEGSDVEFLDLKQDQLSDEASSVESTSALGEDEEDDGSEEDLMAFNAKLAEALGTHPGKEDLNAADVENSDEDMNDEEMEALDEQLIKVFREQKKVTSQRTERKDARKTMVDFKCRVLELLEIFVKKQYKQSLTMRLLPSLLPLIRTTSNAQISQKASNLLRDYSRLCKGKELPQVEDPGPASQMLEYVHEEALIAGSNAHANACSQASLLLVRILAGHNKANLRSVVRTYARTYSSSYKKALFEKNFRVKMVIFIDFNNWTASFGK